MGQLEFDVVIFEVDAPTLKAHQLLIKDTVSGLLRVNIKYVILLTPSPRHEIDDQLKSSRMTNYFSYIAPSIQNCDRKNKLGEALAFCCRGRTLTLPDQAMYIGNSETGLEDARAAGMKILPLADLYEHAIVFTVAACTADPTTSPLAASQAPAEAST